MSYIYFEAGERLVRQPGASTLLVVIHGSGWRNRVSQRKMDGVVDAALDAYPDADLFVPRLKLEFWRMRAPEPMCRRLCAAVNRIWEERAGAGRPYTRVVLIGFSFGSVVARRTFCEACGLDARAEFASPPLPWASAVERIVLLAGMNRGWTTSSPINRLQEGVVRIGTGLGHLAAVVREPTIFAIRRGAPFLTTTRLQWLALAGSGRPLPTVVQLLGTVDDLVSPSDNIDLATASDFFYIEVPESGHFDVVEMSTRAVATVDERRIAAGRRSAFLTALRASPADLRTRSLSSGDLQAVTGRSPASSPSSASQASSDVQHVVFVLHGIRDKGYWTQKVARRIVQRAGTGTRMQSWTSTYGYFAMAPFLIPGARRTKMEWFLDHYVETRARHRGARFSFVGHSNGTYLLGAALSCCDAVSFKRVVLAGSVLPTRFDWNALADAGRVEAVRNYVATADWVVAMFPRLFEYLPLQDLGSAGHDGFARERGSVRDIEYVPGQHSAALHESRWDEIADFLVDDSPETTAPATSAVAARRHPVVVLLGYVSPLIWLSLVTLAVGPTAYLLDALDFPPISGWIAHNPMRQVAPWVTATALGAWLSGLWLVLTKI